MIQDCGSKCSVHLKMYTNYEVIDLAIIESAWDVTRHRATGVIIERKIYASVGFVTEDNKTCAVARFVYTQVHEGARYGPLQVRGDRMSGNRKADCAALKENNK